MKSIAFHTLGCKLNFSETSSLSRMMEAEGFEKKQFEDTADVYVINTCSVTENADKECKQLVRRIRRRNEAAVVVITGCYAQLKPKEIAALEGVDLVLGAAEKFNLPQHISNYVKGDSAKICSCDIDEVKDFKSSYSHADRTRTFLKVQDGCDYNCSFCTIPQARGKSRSDSIEHVLENVAAIAEKGVKEIVLTGINLGDFGVKGSYDFFDLVKALDNVEGIERFRISSIEPNLLSNDIIEFVAQSKKFVPHFHIPLQSGCNKILGLMRRRYRRELYEDRVQQIKKLMPHACIGVDVIVGFPSESKEDFQDTYNFLQALPVSYFHVFTYSERANTHALNITPVVPMAERYERNRQLRSLSFDKQQAFYDEHKGSERMVLWESSNKNGIMEGYSDNYVKVQTTYQEAYVNQIMPWTL